METITSDDILGKEVIDSSGDILGVIQKMHISKKTHEIIGITIDEGFLKPDLFVGIEFIQNFGVDSVFLKIIPKEKHIGLKVYDKDGNKIGKVISADIKRSRVKSIEVMKNNKKIIYKENKIKSIGDHIILK